MVKASDSGSDVRGFKPPHRRFFFFFLVSVPDIYFFFLITIFMIFAPSPYLINKVIDFIYIFYNRKSCTNFRWIPIQELDEIVSDHFGSGDT